MAHPRLTEYLLVLATDANELAQFNGACKDERKALGKAAGLTPQQCDHLATGDSATIMADVLAELNVNYPHGGTHYTIQLPLVLQPCKKNDG